jgi:hypothetical protein
VGQDSLDKELASRLPMKELKLHSEHVEGSVEAEFIHAPAVIERQSFESPELLAKLRHEAYGWPRLIFPPLKRCGHVIIDGCTAEGELSQIYRKVDSGVTHASQRKSCA